jgi:Nif-specific regulatory protein
MNKDESRKLIEDWEAAVSGVFNDFRSLNEKVSLSSEDKVLFQNYFKQLFQLQTLSNKSKESLERYLDKSTLSHQNQDDKKYELLYKSGLILNTMIDMDKLLNTAMDTIIEMTKANRGILALVESDGSYSLTIARNADRETIDKTKKEISDTVIKRAIENHQVIQFKDQFDNSLLEKSSIIRTGLNSIVCVPVLIDGKPRAIIYLDEFTELTYDIYELVQSFAQQLAGFIKNSDLLVELDKSKDEALKELRQHYYFDHIIGKSPQMVNIFKTVAKVADTVATILIQGESGTGKDLIARAIHINSSRREKTFVEIDCGALPSTLIESELFGHKKGAFTGAQSEKVGLLEAADGGTIFLDEINNMPPETQAKLLRALQTKRIRRIGETEEREVDFRLIVASSRILKDQVEQGKFREDLFYRINTIAIVLPPLRDRKTDILELAMFFMKKYAEVYAKSLDGLDAEYIKKIERCYWRGNVRELEHIIERSVILSETDKLTIDSLPDDFESEQNMDSESTDLTLEDYLNEKKKRYIKRVLEECNGKKIDTAKRLGIDRSYLFTLIKKLEIDE